MEDILSGAGNFARLFNSNLDQPVRKHLKNVYGTFMLGLISAAAGVFVHFFSTILGSSIYTAFGALGTLIWLMSTPYDGKNHAKRMGLFLGFAFLSGCNLGPLLEMALIVNPVVILESLLATALIFACFSIAAIVAPRRSYFYLGGMLMSGLSFMFMLSMMNIFFGSRLIFEVNLYIGLAVMCGFIIFDTQNIIEKVHAGDRDHVMHSLHLLINFIGVFRRLLLILTNKEEKKKRRD